MTLGGVCPGCQVPVPDRVMWAQWLAGLALVVAGGLAVLRGRQHTRPGCLPVHHRHRPGGENAGAITTSTRQVLAELVENWTTECGGKIVPIVMDHVPHP